MVCFNATISEEGVISDGEQSVPYQLSWPEMEPNRPVREDTGR